MFETRQNTLLAAGDGSNPNATLSKMGIAAQMSKWDILALGGFMFNTGEPVAGTPLTGGAVNAAGILLTAPAIRFTVPQGLTVFPKRVSIALQAAAGTLNEIAIVASDNNTFTSGGAALTANNWRMDDLRASGVANLLHCSGAALVEAALVNPRHLFKRNRPLAFAAGESFDPTIDWIPDDLIPLVGPCSFLVFIGAATTPATYLFAMDWAEVPSVSV